jgi:hypothetical protein
MQLTRDFLQALESWTLTHARFFAGLGIVDAKISRIYGWFHIGLEGKERLSIWCKIALNE